MTGINRTSAFSCRYGSVRLAALVAILTVTSAAGTVVAQTISTPQEGLTVGSSFLRLRQYEKARAPLEQALRLASDDKMKARVNEMLLPVYYHAGETDKVISSLDVVMSNTESEVRRSNLRSAFIDYMKGSGKTEEVKNRYEARINANPNDQPAAEILVEIYTKLQPNAKRAGMLLDQITKSLKESKGDNYLTDQLANQYVKAGRAKEGAAMFEQLAANTPDKAEELYKSAAESWLKAGDKAKALAAAKAADNSAPVEGLEVYRHRALGDVYLKCGQPALAIPHYEKAIAVDTVGYAKDIKKSLAQAKAMLGRPGTGAGAGTASTSPSGGGGLIEIGETKAAKPGAATKPAAGGTVDLNRATLAQLKAIDGITEPVAIQIIDHRKTQPFTSVSELIELDGVDKALLSKVRGKLTVGGGRKPGDKDSAFLRRLEPLDHRHLVADVVVVELIDESLGEHDAEAPFADSQVVADVEVSDRVFVGGGVGDLAGIEAGALIANDQGDGFGVDPVDDRQHQFGVLAVAPLDRVAPHLHDGLAEILDLPPGQRGMGEQVGEHVVDLAEIGGLAPDVEVDLAVGAALFVFLAPGQGLVDGLVKLVGRERLGEVAVGADPDAGLAVDVVGQRGDDDDGDQVRFAIPFELVADGESVEVGEHQVEQDQIGRVLANGGGNLGASKDLDRHEVKISGLNKAGQDIVGVALIVDDQHGARHGRKPWVWRMVTLVWNVTTLAVVFSLASRSLARPADSATDDRSRLLSRAARRLARYWVVPARATAPLRDGEDSGHNA